MPVLPDVREVVPVPGSPHTFRVEMTDGRGYVAKLPMPDRMLVHAASTGMKVNLKQPVHERILAAVSAASAALA